MSSYIAEAFVAVRADTSGFTKDMKEKVALAVKEFNPTVRLQVTPFITKKDINTYVVDKIRETKATIMVEAVLDPRSKTSINTQLAEIKDQVVHVTAVVTGTTQAAGAAAATVNAHQIVTPVMNQEAFTAIIDQIESVKPTLHVFPILDAGAEARISEQLALMQDQVIHVTPVSTGVVSGVAQTAGAARGRAAGAAEANAEARAAQRLAKADAEVQAALTGIAKGEINASRAKELDEQIGKSLQRVNVGITASIREENAELEDELSTRAKTLTQLQAEVKARALLAEVAANAGTLANAGTDVSKAEANANLALAEANVQKLAAAGELAATSGNANLARNITGTQELVDVQLEEQKVTASAAAAAEEKTAAYASQAKIQAEIDDQIATLTAQVERATSEDFTATQQKSKLIAVDQKLAIVQAELAKATSGATDAQKASILALESKVAAQKEDITTQIAAASAAKRAADQAARDEASGRTTTSQIKRGLGATGATFLGLRGAVLSASTGFLGATIALTTLAKIVKTAEDLQHSLNVFQSVSGATAAQMVLVDEKARLLGADLSLPATSATDAATAMTELAKAGLSVSESMAAAKGVLQLAAAANLDVGSSANIVATELNAFGLAGDQASHIVDNLAGASIAAQGEISDFALAFQQASAVAHQVGLSFEDTTAILTQFAKAGLHGSDAGTSLRTMLLRLVPTSKVATDAQAELGININRNIPIGKQFLNLVDQYSRALAKLGPIAQQEALTKIFGQDAIRGASISLTKGSDALRELEAQTNKTGAAAEITKGRTEGLGGSLEGLKSEVSTFAATLGTSMLPLLESTTHELAAVASTANSVTTEFLKLSQTSGSIGPIKIPSVTGTVGFLGGTDTIAKVAIPLIAAFTTKSLLSGRLREKSEQRVTQAVMSGTNALKQGTISQEQFNKLMVVAGLKEEEVKQIQLSLIEEEKNKTRQLLLTNRQLLDVKKQQAEFERITAASPARIAVASSLARVGTPLAKDKTDLLGSIQTRSKIIDAGEKARAASTADAWLLAYGKIKVDALLTADAQSAAAKTAAEANEVAASLTSRAWLKANEIAGRSAGALKGGRFGGALGAGIAATVAGEAIGGRAGGVLSEAGQGALLGSFIPGPEGPIAGAVIGAGLGLFKQASDAQKKAADAFKQKWNSMSFEEQQVFIALHPGIAPDSNPLRRSFADAALAATIKELGIKKDPTLARFRADLGDVGGANANAAAAAEAVRLAQKTVDQLNAVGASADLIKAAKEDLARKIAAAEVAGSQQQAAQTGFFNRGFFKGAAAQLRDLTVPTRTVELPRASILLPRRFSTVPIPGANPVSQQALQDKETLDKLKQNLRDATRKFGADSNEVKIAIGILNLERSRQAKEFGNLLVPPMDPIVVNALKGVQKLRQISTETKEAMALFAAQMAGNEKEIQAALERIVVTSTNNLKRAQDQLDKAIAIQASAKIIAQKEKALVAASQANAAAIDAAASEIQTNATRFNPASAAAALAATNATNNTQALAAARQQTAADAARLREDQSIATHSKKERDAKRQIIAAAKQQVAQDRAAERGIQAQIKSDAKQALDDAQKKADQAVQNQNDILQMAADAAGNVGAAEDRYIAFLLDQVRKAKGDTTKEIAAQKAYNDELEKRQAAIKAIADARFELRKTGIDNQLARAQATAGVQDDKAAFRAYIKLDTDEIKTWQAIVKSNKSTVLQKIQAMTQIKILRGDIFKQQQAIKDVASNAGGFSLDDLFQSAIQQVSDFGGNLASRSKGEFTGGDVRAHLGLNIESIINQRRNPVADAVLNSGKGIVGKQEETNVLLRALPRKIAQEIRAFEGGTPKKKPVAHTLGNSNRSAAITRSGT